MQLLLQDIADENNDRRRCARKVLQEAIGEQERSDKAPLQVGRELREIGHCGWLLQITHLENSNELVPMVIKYLTRALAYECGKVLSMYISALSQYKTFLEKHSIKNDFDFVSTLSELITVRSRFFSDAFDRSSSLRALAIADVKNAFQQGKSHP